MFHHHVVYTPLYLAFGRYNSCHMNHQTLGRSFKKSPAIDSPPPQPQVWSKLFLILVTVLIFTLRCSLVKTLKMETRHYCHR